MTGIKDRGEPVGLDPRQAPELDEPSAGERRELSPGLMNALALILIGASIGVFWREVFQLTIRAIEALR